jgi:actin beta/gamma 1
MRPAGRDITEWLQKILCDRGCHFPTTGELEIVRLVKERLCYVALDFTEEQVTADKSPVSYELPDGSEIFLGKERVVASELLFNPGLNGIESHGIDELLAESIGNCREAARKDLYANIVLSGGSTMFRGLPERLEKEMTRLAPRGTEIDIEAAPNRDISVWLGGSMLAGSPPFRQMAVTQREYRESGLDIVHHKCF